MTTTHWMGKLTAALAVSLLTGCQLAPAVGSVGALRFSFTAPATASALSFRIQTVPAGTTSFEVEIIGQGLSQPLTQTITLAGGASQTRTISDIPVGPKQVQVRALNGSEVLASASTSVTIEAGKTAQAELDLSALRALVGARLEQYLPLDVAVRLSISGAGIESPIARSFEFKTGDTQAPLGTLPLGAKQVQISMSAGAGDQRVESEALNMSFDVAASGGTLVIPAGVVLKAFEDELEPLLQRANPLVLLGWIQQLKENPARLREFFFLLPPGARERLRANPLVSSFLPAEDETPVATPSPTAPAASPSPIAPVSDLRSDLRLALISPRNPAELMSTPPRDIPREIVVLENSIVPVNSETMFGVLVRSAYSGTGTVSYTQRLTKDDDLGSPRVLFNRTGSLDQQVNLNGRSFSGGIIPFGDSGPIQFPPGDYTLDIMLTEPESGLDQRFRYNLKLG